MSEAMQRRQTVLLVGSFVILPMLPACSLFEGEAPRALSTFSIKAYGIEGECCDWSSEEILTAIVADSIDVNQGFWWVDLVLGDSTVTIRMSDITSDQVPLAVGNVYLFESSFIPMTLVGPNPASFRITHDGTLFFYGATAFPVSGVDVLLPPEAWSFYMEDADHGEYSFYCVVGIKPQTLIVRHGNEEVRMVQGQTKRLGDYMVQARVAQTPGEWDGETECPTDVLIPELSFVIWKVRE